MFPIKEVSALDMAFGGAGGKLAELLPAYKDLPEEFTRHEGKWHKVMSDWFYRGLKNAKWMPKPGVDTKKALAHIKTVLGSFEPKHEHKEAGVAFLLSEWFDDVTYEVMKGEPCA